MRIDTRDLALMAISASLYASINIVQTSMGGPITYGPIQLRLADCLIPLSALFGWPWAMGVTIGCFSNAYYWLDPADVVVGPIVNFTAAFLILLLRKNRALACVSGSLTVGMPIGLYLYYLYLKGNPAMQQVPSFGAIPLPIWSAFVVSLSISSLIIIAGIGYLLLGALSRPNVIEPLKSHGLKALSQNQ
ncbi:MAG: QueT transporter family protein [Candidatus Bathyarchaeia archaeon]